MVMRNGYPAVVDDVCVGFWKIYGGLHRSGTFVRILSGSL